METKLKSPVLYIFSGLPASGKSTLAKLLATETRSSYLRIDTVEQGLRDLCKFKVESEGYRLSYRIIRDNLELGISCISDSCNPIKITRHEWQEVAVSVGAKFVNIEVSCSDSSEHELRINTRHNEVENLKHLTWQEVQNRHYDMWKEDVIKIDTAGKSIETSFVELIEKLNVRSCI